MRVRIFTIVLLTGLALCGAAARMLGVRNPFDRRPNYASAALTAPGMRLDDFHLPRLGGDSVHSPLLVRRPTVIALWSRECSASRAALAGIERLKREYASAGVNVVIVTDDRDTTALARIMRDAGVSATVALAGGEMGELFDRSARAPERKRYRVQFGLPGFLLVGEDGIVVHREVGVPLDEYRSGNVRLTTLRHQLDSLLALPAAAAVHIHDRSIAPRHGDLHALAPRAD